MIKAILFDLDDTLLDRTASLEAFVKKQHQQYQLDRVSYAVYRDRFMELDQRGYAEKSHMFRTLIAEFALRTSVEALLAEFEQQAWVSCTLFPDTSEVLQELRSRGYKLGVITNGAEWSQMRKLRATKLPPLLDLVLISELEQVKKPEAVIFTRAAERLELHPAECAFVGDHPRNDIYGAGAVGMRTIWYPGDQQWPAASSLAPNYTIRNLGELLSIEL